MQVLEFNADRLICAVPSGSTRVATLVTYLGNLPRAIPESEFRI